VVVDIICFRKLGHNEQDTPSLTQPLMYKKIAQHPGTRKLYADKLAAQGMGDTLGDDMVKAYRAAMDAGKHTVDPVLTNFKSKYAVDWAPFLGKKWTDAADTAIPMAEWKRLAERITTVPDSFTVHPLVKKVLEDRAAMGRGDVNVDWGMGEHMAFASLVASGYPVRLSGEDAAAAPSRTATPCCTTRTASAGTPAATCRWRTWPTTRPRSSASTPSCRKKRCWASNTATPRTTPTRW
jgi:2-oxoglutarate dehydrogenase E1 component